MNDYDQAARFAAKGDPAGFLRWLVPGLPPGLEVRGWLDARTLPFPGEPDRVCDTVAELSDPSEPSAGSDSSATVSQTRSGSPGKGSVRASSQPRTSRPGGRPGTSHRRKPAGSPFAANLAAWS